jgi:hypothetical protein
MTNLNTSGGGSLYQRCSEGCKRTILRTNPAGTAGRVDAKCGPCSAL